MKFISHPLLKPNALEQRSFQESIAKTCLGGNTLVVIPTGLGKTAIAAQVAAERLIAVPSGNILVLAPSRPLVLQHFFTFKRIFNLDEDEFRALTGEVSPSKRYEKLSRFCFMTPQALWNDLVGGRTGLENVVLLVVDEAHRAVGNYPYVFIAKQYLHTAKSPLLLALTASPGSTRQRIEEIKRNLNIQFVEARSDISTDVKPYVQPVKLEWLEIEVGPVFSKIKESLQFFIRGQIRAVRGEGLLTDLKLDRFTYMDYTEAVQRLQTEIARHVTPPPKLLAAMSNLAAARRVSYAEEMLETQGLSAFLKYMEKLDAQAKRTGVSQAVKRILNDGAIRDAYNLAIIHRHRGLEHPKLQVLTQHVNDILSSGAKRIIIFTNYRDTAQMLTDSLNAFPQIRVAKLIGQTSKEGDVGLSQQEQTELLRQFADGQYNILIATQVGEEGIDITGSDTVIFYDNIPSALRFIQRRGRTGRSAPGRVLILIAKNTRDEAYYWIAKRKEKAMRQIVRELQTEHPPTSGATVVKPQLALKSFMETPALPPLETNVMIYADHREGMSAVVNELLHLGVKVQLETLLEGDYKLSDDVAAERKTADDLSASIIDKRLFTQAKALKEAYPKPFLIVEGPSLYGGRGIQPNAVRGAIASLMLDFNLPVLHCLNATETALMLYTIAKAEQIDRHTHISLRGEKKPLMMKDLQEYIVASLPNVEQTLAKRLLKYFGTVEKLFTAPAEELEKVRGVGKIIGERIRRVLTENYSVEERGEEPSK